MPPVSNSRAASAIAAIAPLHSCQRDTGLPSCMDVESSTWFIFNIETGSSWIGSTYNDHDVVIQLYQFVSFAVLRDLVAGRRLFIGLLLAIVGKHVIHESKRGFKEEDCSAWGACRVVGGGCPVERRASALIPLRADNVLTNVSVSGETG
jgi:hypothetical protein